MVTGIPSINLIREALRGPELLSSPPEAAIELVLVMLLEFAPHTGRSSVPDPYYGGSVGFEHVLDLVEEAAAGVLEHLRRTEPPAPRRPRAPDAR